jgi:hypothetical protein
MPDGTSNRKWRRNKSAQESDITKALNLLFENPPSLAGLYQTEFTALQQPGALQSASNEWTGPLSSFMETQLPTFLWDPDLGISDADLLARAMAHIQDWPNNDPDENGKEQLRQVLVAAMGHSDVIPIMFRWRLKRGLEKEQIKIDAVPGKKNISAEGVAALHTGQKIIVTFINPAKNVADPDAADVKIKVGPEGE